MSETKKELTERPASDTLKKRVQLKTVEKLSDDDMEKVAGGFKEQRGGYANNCEIECPYCGETRIDWIFAGQPDGSVQRDPYYCYNCGNWFEVDANNVLWY